MFVSPLKRRVIVNDFQYRLLAGNLLYLLSLVLVFFVALFGPVMIALTDDALSFSQKNDAARQLLVLHERVWFALPVLIALCIFHSILVSHRIAGPLHRFKLVLAALANGDLSQNIVVRKNDYLAEEAAVLEAMVRNTRARLQAIDGAYARADVTLQQLMQALAASTPGETKSLASRLQTEMDSLGTQLQGFELHRVPELSRECPAEIDRPLAVG